MPVFWAGNMPPPFGMLLVVIKPLTGIPIGVMMQGRRPFAVTLLLAKTEFPQIALWSPQTMGYVTH